MKIVIFGLSKSGTSALFYKVRNSLPACISLFEPVSYGATDRLREHLKALKRGYLPRHVVAKVLPEGRRPVRLRDFDAFERQVLIVRDPRDRLVSALLYRSYHADFAPDDAAALEYIALVRRKEADPGAVPLLRLVEAFERLEKTADALDAWIKRYRTRAVTRPLHFHAERPLLPVFQYEDLVDQRFGRLEEIVGFPLSGAAAVPDNLKRVVRTKGAGAWRNWLTPEDIGVLRPLLAPYMEAYYPGGDWDLSEAPAIRPEHASLYVTRLIDERRALTGLPPVPA